MLAGETSLQVLAKTNARNFTMAINAPFVLQEVANLSTLAFQPIG